MDIRIAISRIRPTSEYHWLGGDGTDYASIGEWRDAQTTKPTLAELQAAWDAYLIEQETINAAAQVKATAETGAVTGFQTLPAFVKTMTAAEAEAHINSQIFNGQTKAQLDASIDAAIVNITTANVAQINTQLAAIRTMLKAAVGALIGIRDLFIFTSKLLLYIRDLVIRFRQ